MKAAKRNDIDILPTVCGVITILDLILFNGAYLDAIKPMYLLFAITPVVAAITLLLAVRDRRPFSLLRWVNVGWLVGGVVFTLLFLWWAYHVSTPAL